jgi:DNA (cytosine-5)-methyltransferase 1
VRTADTVACVVDLFAGAGGLSIGATQADCRVGASVELDSWACKTLRANPQFHGEVVEGDVCDLSGTDLRRIAKVKVGEPFVVVGGPPCQGFSKAAYWTESGDEAAYRRARSGGIELQKPVLGDRAPDARRDLVFQYWRLVAESDADAFVFENVPSIKHPRNRIIYDLFISKALARGYELTELTVNAARFGVAQTRERVIVIGSKGRRPPVPSPSHALVDENGMFLKSPATAGDALAEFHGPEYFEPEEVVTGRWAEHLKSVPPGENYKAHTAWAGHPNPTFVAETRFWNFLLKLSPARPSWTLAASPGPWVGPFHWTSRRLRIPEMAALQTFPRGYKIEGPRRERIRQMGNAVPVAVAKAMVSSAVASLMTEEAFAIG